MLFRSPPWDAVVYQALDLETGGLDPRRDPILAVGMVPLRGGFIRLGEAYRTLVRPEDATGIGPESVRAHQIVRGDLADAPPLAEVLREVDRRLRDAVLLVHHQQIDVRFLRRAYDRTGLRWPAPRVVDTAALLVKLARLTDPGVPLEVLPLSLPAARRSHGLPDYQAHDALTDALAAAELFLVLRSALGARTVRDLR